jgi:hypothetical protein
MTTIETTPTASAVTIADTAESKKPTMIVWSLDLDGGNEKAGAKAWAKQITGIDLVNAKTCYGFEGKWLDEAGCLPAGSFVLIGGKGGSWKNSTSSYVLAQIEEGATLEFDGGYQHFKGNNIKLLASDGKIKGAEAQAILSRYPELAPAVGGVLLPLFFEYLPEKQKGKRSTSDSPLHRPTGAQSGCNVPDGGK